MKRIKIKMDLLAKKSLQSKIFVLINYEILNKLFLFSIRIMKRKGNAVDDLTSDEDE